MEPPTPGPTRLTLRASRPGLYRGRCAGGDACPNRTMPLLVVAEKGEEFEAWREHQLRGAEPPATGAAEEGREIFLSGPCIMCHTVRGTSAGGKVGPDLTHLGSRHLIAGGFLPRGRDTLAALIFEPARLKPGIEMPGTRLGPEELVRLVSYLESLR
jgi:cytochrome c oxidase subunit 2